ncbi:MAG: class I SAM-dependent methyltransferase, partial [Pseudomonadales bacterium]|nr:class I SAM-dependent methyltransferase [Pseudomonadales bacterium]
MQHKSPMATLGLLVACLASMTWADALNNNPAERYVNKAPSRDGIGKYYLGREISHVMGHRGASWLERPERQRQERTDLLINNLPLQANSVVADIGAGTGYFSFPVAKRLPKGRVLAVDIQPEMLAIIAQRQEAAGISNVETILGAVDTPNL